LHHSEQFCDHRDSYAKSLDHILADSRIGSQYFVSRRRRYRIALLIASTVAQLKATPWLFSGLGKKDIKFFPLVDAGGSVIFGEPFIEKEFHGTATSRNHSTTDFNFQSLGIILLELCFGHRLEDHPIRRKYAPGNDAQSEAAFDLIAAIAWLQNVEEEAGADYASAVRWCFTCSIHTSKTWQIELVRNVVQPLEKCQKLFEAFGVARAASPQPPAEMIPAQTSSS
jgi:hypothetical protein